MHELPADVFALCREGNDVHSHLLAVFLATDYWIWARHALLVIQYIRLIKGAMVWLIRKFRK